MKKVICIVGTLSKWQTKIEPKIEAKINDNFFKNIEIFTEKNIFKNSQYHKNIFNIMQEYNNHLVIGEDRHVDIESCQSSVNKNNNTGCLWIYTHPDIHTKQLSESGNIPGMPLEFIINNHHINALIYVNNLSNIVNKNYDRVHTSIDIAEIDPEEMPSTGFEVVKGLSMNDVIGEISYLTQYYKNINYDIVITYLYPFVC